MAVAEFPLASVSRAGAANVTRAGVPSARPWFALLSLLGLAAFVLGVENRFTVNGLFALPPLVDWIPPLSEQSWAVAFATHQQDPVFAACGGTETLAQFKLLYWWEWARRASLLALTAGATIAVYAACLWPRYRFMLWRLGGLSVVLAAWWPVRAAIELAIGADPATASFNVGQYRHAIDVAFASAAMAGVLASAVAPPLRQAGAGLRRAARTEWLWIAGILLDICVGALFASRDAAAYWATWPGYEGHVLPRVAQLMSYSPWWLNFTFNPYMIQLAHRILSGALWIAALGAVVVAMRRAVRVGPAVVRFALISAQMAAGIATLLLGVPSGLSVVHQVGAIVVLAASLAFWWSGRNRVPVRPRRSFAVVR